VKFFSLGAGFDAMQFSCFLQDMPQPASEALLCFGLPLFILRFLSKTIEVPAQALR
jgi:hypothetical protein